MYSISSAVVDGHTILVAVKAIAHHRSASAGEYAVESHQDIGVFQL